MIRIGFVGVPGTGKTSTARGVASSCRGIENLKNIELVNEYARRYINKYGSIENLWEQVRIFEKQLEWEESIPNKIDLMITDSPLHMGFIYCSELMTNNSKDILLMNDIFKRMNKINNPPRYDIIFYLPPVLKAVDDGTRRKEHFNDEWRERNDNFIKVVFGNIFKPQRFITLTETTIEDRVKRAIEVLERQIGFGTQNMF